MKAYKVVKRKRNGDRVSVLVPDWHPCYTVYMHQGKINTATGFAFYDSHSAKKWLKDQYCALCTMYCELKKDEVLEIWEISCEKDSGYHGYILDLEFFLSKSRFGHLKHLRSKILAMSWYQKIIDVLIKKTNISVIRSVMENTFMAKNIRLERKIYSSEIKLFDRKMPGSLF